MIGRGVRTSAGGRGGAGDILAAVRSGAATTRGALAHHTGMARGTVARRLDELLDAGLLVPGDNAASTGGRPPETFEVNARVGAMLVADVGVTRTRVAVCDALGTILAEHEELLDVQQGPEPVLDEIDRRWRQLLDGTPDPPPVRGVGMGVPGPVDQEVGAAVSPPIMTGWDRYPIRRTLSERYGCLAHVDNDANAMGFGEQREALPEHHNVLFVKVGTGVGAGFVLHGEIFRGAIGAAGDIGHMQMTGVEPRRCICGNTGCVEAVSGGWALRELLAERGVEADSSRAVVDLVRRGNPDAVELFRRAADVLGAAISYAVNLFNPSVVVIGGDFAHAHEHLLAGVRSVVYQRSLPLATSNLSFLTSRLDRRAGVVGVSHLVADLMFAPAQIDRQLAGEEDPAATGGSRDPRTTDERHDLAAP